VKIFDAILFYFESILYFVHIMEETEHN